MKKLLLTLLISLSTVALAETPKGFFGIELMKNAKQYATDAQLAGKTKNTETISGYNNILINPPEINPYFENYSLAVNDRNIIHEIKGFQYHTDLQVCLREVKTIKNKLEEKYNFKLLESEITSPGFKAYRNSIRFSNSNYLIVQCNDYTNGDVYALLAYTHDKLKDAVNKFYNSGI